MALAKALLARSVADPEFKQEFENWWQKAEQFRPGIGNVTNTITGGTLLGPVMQAGSIQGTTISTSAMPPAVSPPHSPGPADDG